MTIPVLPGVVKLLPQKSKVEKKKVDCVHCGEKVIEDFMKYHLSSASCKWKREQKDKNVDQINPKLSRSWRAVLDLHLFPETLKIIYA